MKGRFGIEGLIEVLLSGESLFFLDELDERLTESPNKDAIQQVTHPHPTPNAENRIHPSYHCDPEQILEQ